MSDSNDSEVDAAFARSNAVPNQRQLNVHSTDLINEPGPSGIIPNKPPENASAEKERNSTESPARASENTDCRRTKRRSRRSQGSRNNFHREFYPPSPWMAQKIPQKTYFPQIFDSVVYLRQAHEIYLSVIKRMYPQYCKPRLPPPWELFDLDAEEPCQVTGVEFVLCPARMCRMQLYRTKKCNSRQTVDRFWICYHPVPEAVDFLLLRDIFNRGPKQEWYVEDRFRCIVPSNTWRLGTITSITPLESRFPESHFQRYEVRWDDGTDGRVSFWDLEPVDLEGLVNLRGEEIPLGELAWLGVSRSPDMPLGDRRIYRNIFVMFNEVLQKCFCEPFVNASHERADPIYLRLVAYPIDFHLIMSRYVNGFYRRIASLLTDIDYMQRNALLFYPQNHDCARVARFCHGLLTRIISNYNRNVHMSIIFHDSVLEQAEDELESEEDRRERSKNRARPNNEVPQDPGRIPHHLQPGLRQDENRPPILRVIPNNEMPQNPGRAPQHLQPGLRHNENRPPILREIPINEVPQDPGRVPHHLHPGLRQDENRPPILREIPNNEVPQNLGRAPQHLQPGLRHNENRPPILREIPNNEVPQDLERAPQHLQPGLHHNENRPPILQEIPINEVPQDPGRVPHHLPPGLRHYEIQAPILWEIPNNEVLQNPWRAPQHLLADLRQVREVPSARDKRLLSFMPALIDDYKRKLVAAQQSDNPQVNTGSVRRDFFLRLHAPARQENVRNQPQRINLYRGHVYYPQIAFRFNLNQPSANQLQNRNLNQPLVEANQNQPSTSQSQNKCMQNLFMAYHNQSSMSYRRKRIRNPPLVFLTNEASFNQRQVHVRSPPLVLGQVQNQSSTSEHQQRDSSPALDLSTHDNRPLTSENQERVSNSPPVLEIDQNQPMTSENQERVSNSLPVLDIYQNHPSTSQFQARVSYSPSLLEINQSQPSTSHGSVNSPPSDLESDLNQLSTSLLRKRASSPKSVFETDQIQLPTNEPQECPDSPPIDLTTERKQPPTSQRQKRISNPSSLGLNVNQPSTSHRRQKPLNSPLLSSNVDYNKPSTDQPLALNSKHRRKHKRATSKHYQQLIESSSSLSDSTATSTSESNKSEHKRKRAGIINKILIKANVWRFDCMEVVQNLWDDINDAMSSEPAMHSYRRGAFEWHNLEEVMYNLKANLFGNPYAVLSEVHMVFLEGRRLNKTADKEVSRIIDRLSLNFNRGMEPILNRWNAFRNVEERIRKVQEYKRYKNLPGMPESPPLSPP